MKVVFTAYVKHRCHIAFQQGITFKMTKTSLQHILPLPLSSPPFTPKSHCSDYLISFAMLELGSMILYASDCRFCSNLLGSAWMMLSRPFIEYCLWGWDNLPRIVLMYYANFLSSPEGYFHTVICNANEFRNTTVNHDLHFISWDNPPKQHPHFLTVNDYRQMVDSNAPFARKFGKNELVLDKIDSELLCRNADGFVPGGWFHSEGNSNMTLVHNVRTNTTELKPGHGAERLKRLVSGLLSAEDFHAKQCS